MNRPPNWLEIGQKDANKWLKENFSGIKAQKNIENQKERHDRRQAKSCQKDIMFEFSLPQKEGN